MPQDRVINALGPTKPIPCYAMAIVLVSASLLLQFGLDRYWDLQLPPFIVCYPAVMLVALLGGIRPGLLATLLGALGADYLFISPVRSLAVAGLSQALALGLFSAMGVFMSLVAGKYKRSQHLIALHKEELAVRESKEELRKATEYRQLALDAAGMGLWEIRTDAGETTRDENTRKLCGLSSDESLTNDAFRERIHPEDRATAAGTVKLAMAGANGALWGTEYRVIWPDGSIHWIASYGQRFTNRERGVDSLVGVSMDVTERKRVEDSLRKSEVEHRLLLEQIPDGIFVSDAQGRFLDVNPAGVELMGYGSDELRDLTVPDILPPEEAERLTDILARFRGGGVVHFEMRHKRKDGSIFDASVTGRQLSDGRLISSIRNVSKQKHDEEDKKKLLDAVQKERDYLSALISAMKDEVWFIDAEERVALVNPAVLDSFGSNYIPNARISEVGRGIEFRRADGSLRPIDESPPMRALRGETVRTEEEILLFPGTGKLRHREVSAEPLKDAEGTIIGSLVVVHDITRRKHAEEELRQKEAQFRNLANSIPQLCWMANPDGGIFWFNERWYEYTGTNLEQMEDWGWLSLVATEALPAVMAQLKNSIDTKSPCELTFPLKSAAGDFRFFLTHVVPIFDADGQVSRWIGTNTDITDQKRAEEELRKSEMLYRGLFSSMNEGFCRVEVIFDPEEKPVDLRFIEVNEAFEEQSGLHDVVGRRVSEVAPTLEQHWFELYGKVALTGDPLFLNDAEGVNRNFEVHAYRVGEPTQRQVAVVFNDISERKKAEEHIRQLNRVYSVLSDINQTIVREKDSKAMLESACEIAVEKGRFRMAWIGMIDPATLQLNRVACSGIVDGYLDQVKIDLRDPNSEDGPIANCFRSGEHAICNDIEHELLRPWRNNALQNGYRSVAAFPLRHEGRVVGVFSLYASELAFFNESEIRLLDELATDISFALEIGRNEEDRKRKEEELRWRTAFFEAQVESSLDGILVVDHQGRIILQNKRACQLWKIPSEIANEDYLRQVQFVISMTKNPDQFVEKMEYLYAHPDEVSQDEIELLDGTLLDRYSSPVKDKAGTYYGRIWMFHDITRRRRLEEQFRQSQKMEAIGQLTGGIAHDFNNLLAVIIGNLDLLERQIKGNEAAVKRVNTARNASLRGAEVTRRLLAFARQQDLKPAALDINTVIKSVLALAAPALGPAIQTVTTLDQSVPQVLADSSGLENAFLNLLVNARDAMPKGGKLTITSEIRTLEDGQFLGKSNELTPGRYAFVTVSDTGHGMSKETSQKVFEPFFTTKSQGTGLGLAMVYGFFKQSGGTIRVYSELGSGTTFSFYLPLADGAEVLLPSTPMLETHSPVVNVGTILVVDDDADLREIVSTCLGECGYSVLTAADGESAGRILNEHSEILLLITDILMPGGENGAELALRAVEINPQIRIVYCSGFQADALAESKMSLAEGPLLRKPYQRHELLAIVRDVLSPR
jgi:PAS domain S-box-containing protein